MKFSVLTSAFCLAASAFASPVAVGDKAARSPPPPTDTTSTAPSPSTSASPSDVPVPEIIDATQTLVTLLAPGLVQVLSGAGLEELAKPINDLVTVLTGTSECQKENIDIPEMEGLDDEQAELVYCGMKSIVQNLALDAVEPGQRPEVESITDATFDQLIPAIASLLQKLNLAELAPGLPPPAKRGLEPRAETGLLPEIAPELTTLATALNVGFLAPLIGPVLNFLSAVI